MTTEVYEEKLKQFAQDLAVIRDRAIWLALYATANGPLHEAVRKVGYEIAEIIESNRGK